MSHPYLDQHQLRTVRSSLRPRHVQAHHHRVYSAPDVPFSWEMSPGVSKQHDKSSNSMRYGRGQFRHVQLDHHHDSSGTSRFNDDQDLSPHYLVHENARRAIQKPPLRPPPCLTSSPRVSSSSRSEQLVSTRGTPKPASKLARRNKGGCGGADADPFFAAYMKCTTPQKAAPKRKSSGFGFSCKSSFASRTRDDAMIRIPRPSKV